MGPCPVIVIYLSLYRKCPNCQMVAPEKGTSPAVSNPKPKKVPTLKRSNASSQRPDCPKLTIHAQFIGKLRQALMAVCVSCAQAMGQRVRPAKAALLRRYPEGAEFEAPPLVTEVAGGAKSFPLALRHTGRCDMAFVSVAISHGLDRVQVPAPHWGAGASVLGFPGATCYAKAELWVARGFPHVLRMVCFWFPTSGG